MSAARLDAASRAQAEAADPAGSVWLAANAGSGKTRVLTDRVAWLLLEGTRPDRILCLTFTKAAAGEMQNRLFRRLGEWALMPDADLRARLHGLGVAPGRVDARALRRARTLFADAIETPGGLKIQTIHAFCDGLLRRFPLEAGVAPGFRQMDEVSGRRLIADVLDAMVEDPADAPLVEAIHAAMTDQGRLFEAIAAMRDRLSSGAGEAALRDALGLAMDEDARTVARDALDAGTRAAMTRFADAARAAPGKSMDGLAAALAEACRPNAEAPLATALGAVLTTRGEPRKCPLTKDAKDAYGDGWETDWADLAETLTAAQDRLRSLAVLDRARMLHAFAPRFLARLAAEKAARGWLDFTDLILRTRALLSDSTAAQWVLWKLDGGIDHVLVDEAQDTSPEQWAVIAPLVDAFGGGAGGREDVARTLFVVGDRKQSIYSFQGADPDVFDARREAFRRTLAAGVPLADRALRHSFRSAPAILRVVDRVFDAPSGAGGPTTHIAFHPDKPGRIDLWPHVPKPDAPEGRVWFDPVDRPAENDAEVVLARRIADAIGAMTTDGTTIAVREGEATVRRAVEPRDVLILVRSRGSLFDAILRECKRAGLDMAGADRLRLAEELAVRDLLALCQVAATPEDDLALAGALRSPLMGLSEADLFALAHDRPGYLWRRLHDHGGFPKAAAMLDDVMGQADFLRPYELLQRILTHHDGRRRLLGRLGPEVGEAIDGLLHHALAYEALEVPSLTGFLGWIAEAEIEIRREGMGGAIRLMTIHGAKGLEAPVVIVPQCGAWESADAAMLIPAPRGGPMLWRVPAPERDATLAAAVAAREAAQAAERDRLLYVALTRAESWLICASAGGAPAKDADPGDWAEGSWADRLRRALQVEGAAPLPGWDRPGLRLEEEDWSVPADPRGSRAAAVDAAPPDWIEAEAPAPDDRVRMAAPSELGGAKALADGGLDVIEPEAARRRGTQTHLLLEHLPALPPADRAAAARPILARHAEIWPEDDPDAVLAEALATIEAHPAFFAPGTLAEMPFVLPAADGRPGLSGTMDRVLVGPDAVTVVDFKTNRSVPAGPDAVPEGILRQMGAYRAAAAAIWPGRAVRGVVVWTATGVAMPVPGDLAAAAWARA